VYTPSQAHRQYRLDVATCVRSKRVRWARVAALRRLCGRLPSFSGPCCPRHCACAPRSLCACVIPARCAMWQQQPHVHDDWLLDAWGWDPVLLASVPHGELTRTPEGGPHVPAVHGATALHAGHGPAVPARPLPPVSAPLAAMEEDLASRKRPRGEGRSTGPRSTRALLVCCVSGCGIELDGTYCRRIRCVLRRSWDLRKEVSCRR
jgi:hypothetical protein